MENYTYTNNLQISKLKLKNNCGVLNLKML